MTVRLYRKKPVMIEAIQLSVDTSWVEIWDFCDQVKAVISGVILGDRYAVTVKTLEGDMVARIGDYIIKGVAGEFYPCKPDIFEQTYEEVATDA